MLHERAGLQNQEFMKKESKKRAVTPAKNESEELAT